MHILPVVEIQSVAIVDSILGLEESQCQTECEQSGWICVRSVRVSSASRLALCRLFMQSSSISYALFFIRKP